MCKWGILFLKVGQFEFFKETVQKILDLRPCLNLRNFLILQPAHISYKKACMTKQKTFNTHMLFLVKKASMTKQPKQESWLSHEEISRLEQQIPKGYHSSVCEH